MGETANGRAGERIRRFEARSAGKIIA